MFSRTPSFSRSAPTLTRLPQGALGVALLMAASASALGCSRSHWAQVETTPLPAPPAERVLHTGRLIVSVEEKSHQVQCVVDETRHPVCFYNLYDSLNEGLARSLWPSFPEVVVGSPRRARPGDYVLQVEVTLDALRPDADGPGWSAGARSRYRLLRDGKVLAEQTMASRSRPHFAYGAPLGEGATEVVDATVIAVARAVSEVPELSPLDPVPLPRVATHTVVAPEPQAAPSLPVTAQTTAPELVPRLLGTKNAPSAPHEEEPRNAPRSAKTDEATLSKRH